MRCRFSLISPADRHGALAPVKPAGSEETKPRQCKQNKKRADIQQDQFAVGQLDILRNKRKANAPGYGRQAEHCQQRTDQIDGLCKDNCTSFGRSRKHVGHGTAVHLPRDKVVGHHNHINDRQEQPREFIENRTDNPRTQNSGYDVF